MTRFSRVFAPIAFAAALLWAAPVFAETAEDIDALGQKVRELFYARKYDEALPMARRALELSEKLPPADEASLGFSLHNLALVREAQGAADEAMVLYERALPMREKDIGGDNIEIGQILNNLAALYQRSGRYTAAEPLYNRMIPIFEKALGPDHAAVATGLNNLAELYKDLGRFAEAEPVSKRSLAIREKTLGLDHPAVGTSLNNLAALLTRTNRMREAIPLYKRSLDISERQAGTDGTNTALALNNLAYVYKELEQFAEAEPLYLRALALREKALGENSPEVGQSLNNLAELYRAQGRFSDAEPLLLRDLAIGEKTRGPEHPAVATTRNNLAKLYQDTGRLRQARETFEKALSSTEAVFGEAHPMTGVVLDNLSSLAFLQSDWETAASYGLRSTDGIKARFRRGTGATASAACSSNEVEGLEFRFRNLVKAAYRLAEKEPATAQDLASETFEAAQWALQSKAAQSLARMAARSATGSTDLAKLVRERQDLVIGWEQSDAALTALRALPPEQRSRDAEAALATRLSTFDARLQEIDASFTKDFPAYRTLANPEPLSLEDVQLLLKPDEALILLLDTPAEKPTPEETFIWVVTQKEDRWLRSAIGRTALLGMVTALRCGLDEAAWNGGGVKLCNTLLGRDAAKPRHRGTPLPFDSGIALRLYKGLFDGLDDLIEGKHLLIVPSGGLASLPLQVLVTSPANDPAETGKSPHWLIRDHALTVLPSVASLAALRRNAKASSASGPYIGFGNPVLTGSPRCGKIAIPQGCPGEPSDAATQSVSEVSRAIEPADDTASYFRSGLADVAAVKTRLCPLPDTAYELTCVAKSLGAIAPGAAGSAKNVILGASMTETRLKQEPLEHFRIIHFATHGLLAGETAQLAAALAEPSLVMSPPDVPTAEDDGLLTASEITALKLDADWVVMSACNTAAGGATGAEALSGLARAFFYAGSRALLVSHWPVNSYAATVLTSGTFAEMKSNPHIGRSEALRRAMLALMSDAGRPWASHPSVWAPFVVVGEGGDQ